MESTISADVIYHYVAKLQREGQSDEQIKKTLSSGVLEEENMLQLLQNEALFIQKAHRRAFKKRNFIFSAFGFVAVYLILNPFLGEKASQLVFLVLALGLSALIAIRLRSLYL
jgi:hypothetical protein